MRKILSILFLFALSTSTLYSQERLVPLVNNRTIKSGQEAARLAPSSVFTVQSLGDTMNLPFRDDFSRSFIFPDTNRWSDRAVYINNTFPINPPSFNVATFDALDRNGNAYSYSPGDPYGAADTLTSKYLDLSSYTPADSLYLSFFYQPQGIGPDSLQKRDSLIVQCYNKYGAWVYVWGTPGFKVGPFRYAMIRLTDTTFMHSGFRFRLMNFAGLTGNLNQWHVDYVRLEENRHFADTVYRDVAINFNPRPLLRNYTSLPWRQFKNAPSPASEWVDTMSLRVRNLDTLFIQVFHEYVAYDISGNVIGQSSANLNLVKYDTALYRLNKINVPLPSSTPADSFMRYKVRYTVNSTSDLNRLNDTLWQTQDFSNYIAYDDGTAESGYSLEGAGKVALRFQLFTPDTLRAIRMYFNQAEFDARNKAFTLTLWSNVSNTKEKIRHQQLLLSSPHTDVSTGLATIVLDTPQYIDPATYPNGVFYIGWQQALPYAVNVGFDMNYERLLPPSAVSNPNLSFNTAGLWIGSIFRGTPMIRPVFGNQVEDPLGVQPVPQPRHSLSFTAHAWPNPTTGLLHVATSTAGDYTCEVYDLSGRMLHHQQTNGTLELDASGWQPGVYLLKVRREADLSQTFLKFVKQ